MIEYKNFELYVSITIFVAIKIVSKLAGKYRVSMYDKKSILTSIPENTEVGWVPKKKHDVLKAKYKCLKKLFQIYDASVIGILPQNPCQDINEAPTDKRRRRRKRTKTDASTGTETSSGESLSGIQNIAVPVIEEINLNNSADSNTIVKIKKEKYDKSTQDFKENDRENESVQTLDASPIHYIIYERQRPTRFQNFLYRICGIRSQKRPDCPATSEYDICSRIRYEKRRRRGLRFRNHRPKRINSEIALRNLQKPVASYVESMQRNYLTDILPRQCPIRDCGTIFYGIINYNDHLNLYHFTDRKYTCRYCHQGFSRDDDKVIHENNHLGIAKSRPTAQSDKTTNDTQTDPETSKMDVPDEKLKRIVSFFDKLSEPDQVIDEIKKKIYSESNIESLKVSSESGSADLKDSKSGQRSARDNFKPKKIALTASDINSSMKPSYPRNNFITCNFCGENFNFRRQLCLHKDIEHRINEKFSKYHSCPGITKTVVSKSGNIQDESVKPASSTCTTVSGQPSRDPSMNIVFYTSAESVLNKPSAVASFVKKVRSYKWEPNTKIVRV